MTDEKKAASALLLAAKAETLKQVLARDLYFGRSESEMINDAKQLAKAINAAFDEIAGSD